MVLERSNQASFFFDAEVIIQIFVTTMDT